MTKYLEYHVVMDNVSSILTLQLKIYNMKYELVELKEMIDNLKKVKKSDKWGLTDKSEIDLTTYELLVETYLIKKVINDIFTK